MRTFTPGAATKAFYDQLITIANAPPYQALNAGGNVLLRLQPYTLPTPPPTPADPLDAGFLAGICMPLYNALVAAYAADAAAYATVIGSPTNPATQPTIYELQQAAAAGDTAAQQAYNEYLFQQASSSAP